MQCPLCNRTYSSGKFCTSCEGPDGGAVRLVATDEPVDPNDLDQYIKMLDVFLSDGFLGADEKETLRGLRQQYGISEQQHQSILKENGYKYRETMPVRMVLNRKTIQGYGAGQPCLAKVRLVNTERMPLQRVEIRYWLNSEEVHTTLVRQLMPNKVYDVDLDFIPQKSGQYALKMELTVDPFVGDQTEYVVESTSFQVYSQSQLQSVHIHQSADNIVGNHKVHGTDMPKAMLLGDGQWDELTLSPKQRAVEWGEWTSERLFTNLSQSIHSASQQYGVTPEFERFVKGLSLERKENEDFITWEERLKGIQGELNQVAPKVSARLEAERKQKEAEEKRQREAAEKRQRELKAEQERKAREEAERQRKEEEEQRRLTKEGEALYRDVEKLLDKTTYEIKQESDFKTLSTTCKKFRKPTGRQTLQTWVKKLTKTKSDLPSQLSNIAEARKKRLEAERKAKEAEEKRKREEEARKERERQAKLKLEEEKQIEAERKARKKKEDELTILKLRYVRLLEQADKTIEDAFDPVGLTQFKSSLQAKLDLAEKKGLHDAIEFLQGIDDWSTREWMKQCQLDADRKKAEHARLEAIRLEKERKERAEVERKRKERERIEAEKRRQREEQERKEREARAKAKREKEERERKAREETERQRLMEEKRLEEEELEKQVRIQRYRQAIIDEGNRQRLVSREEIMVKVEYGGILGFGKRTAEYPMLRIPSGWFIMSARGYGGSGHKVTLTRGFLVGKYPVTQSLWESVMGSNPSEFKGAHLPVENVSWFESVEFCNKLSKREGLEPAYTINCSTVVCNWNAKGYRLPTEAEWEYSARGGEYHTYSGSDNKDEVAWYGENSEGETHPVGQKKPNGFGLYDMSGNVSEWCWNLLGSNSIVTQTDPLGPEIGTDRLYRGGSWRDNHPSVDFRVFEAPEYYFDDLGLRLVRIY